MNDVVSQAETPSVARTKFAAMAALSALSPFEPVARIDYVSHGRLLVLAERETPLAPIERLAANLTVSFMWTGQAGSTPQTTVETVCAKPLSISGYLGAFAVTFQPEKGAPQVAPFDLILDLRATPAFDAPQPPQGYYHASDDAALQVALTELPGMTGEFEKPKFFAYKESICAHSRSKKTGCSQCIEVCSTGAISSAGDIVKVDPHLCMGCGACATVCPSGAMSYQYPRVADRGTQLKAMLGAWRREGKANVDAPVVLFHNETDGQAHIDAQPGGLPDAVLPVSSWHVASIGPDLLLGAMAYGAGHVAILAAGSETPAYRAALQRSIELAQTIASALGYAGRHFSLVSSAAEIHALAPAEAVTVPAGFNLANDKRTAIEFSIEHLLAQGRVKPQEIALPAGSPFGAIAVNTQDCTLCMACVGACPESALMDGGERPALKFLERNCVQCGLCETTCPEKAISLQPRLLLDNDRKRERILNESEPFNCVSCGKVLGTKQIVDAMLGRLSTHSMFQGEGALKRLQMCADCRVVDMMSNPNEVSILTGRPMP